MESAGLRSIHPDDFVLRLIEADPLGVRKAFDALQTVLKRPPMSAEILRTRLETLGLKNSMKRLILEACSDNS